MSVLQEGLEASLAGGVGEACYIRHFCLSKLVIREERAEKLAGSEPGRRRK